MPITRSPANDSVSCAVYGTENFDRVDSTRSYSYFAVLDRWFGIQIAIHPRDSGTTHPWKRPWYRYYW